MSVIYPDRDVMEDLLALLIEVEDKMKQLYLSFSSLFSHLPKVCSFWERMAFHELRQAHLLGAAKDVVKDADLPGAIAISPDRVQELSQKISRCVTVAKEGVPLSRAFAMALELERQEAELPWMMLTTLGKATIEEALRDLHGPGQGHLSQLEEMTRRFSGSEDPGEPKDECG